MLSVKKLYKKIHNREGMTEKSELKTKVNQENKSSEITGDIGKDHRVGGQEI